MSVETEKRQLTFPVAMIVVAGLAVVAAVIVRSFAVEQPSQDQARSPSSAAAPVRVVTIERREIPVFAAFHGFLEPFVDLTIAAQVAGEITEQWVDVADGVSSGQRLFKIDDETRKFEREQALTGRAKARNELETAKANWERVRAIPEQSLTSLEHIEAHRRFLSAEANVVEADVAASHAELMLERTTVTSPIQGVISHIHQRKGEFVRRGQPLLDVIETDRLKLVAEVADHEVVWIRPGDRVTLVSDALPGESFAAAVHRVYPQALTSSRRFQIEIQLPNPQRRLHVGFFVRGEIVQGASGGESDTAVTTLVVPRAALFERYGQFFVYRIEVDETEGGGQFLASQTPVVVQPVRSDPRIMQVSSGLSEGDRVVTKGIGHLTDGVRVRIVE